MDKYFHREYLTSAGFISSNGELEGNKTDSIASDPKSAERGEEEEEEEEKEREEGNKR